MTENDPTGDAASRDGKLKRHPRLVGLREVDVISVDVHRHQLLDGLGGVPRTTRDSSS